MLFHKPIKIEKKNFLKSLKQIAFLEIVSFTFIKLLLRRGEKKKINNKTVF